MKKLFSLLIALMLLFSCASSVLAENVIELNPLKYDAYMRGETIFITGTANVYVTLGLYYPESYNSMLKYAVTYSPTELANGVEILLGTEEHLWPDGVWTIVCQNGDARQALEFEICETVEHPEPEKPTRPHSGNTSSVTLITLSPSDLTIEAGKTATVDISSSATSFTVECDNEDVVSASVSGKKLTVKALKRGTSEIWVRSGGNYAALNVTVTMPEEQPTQAPTDPPTEKPTEEETTPVSFNDIDSHWAKDDIMYLASRGIVSGMGGGAFVPEDKVTRAQFVTMLKNAFGFENTCNEEIFPDVLQSDWYYEPVMAAYSCGITQGSDGKFNPNALVTRQDMAVFAFRAALKAGLPLHEGAVPFSDDLAIADYAKEAVYIMRATGIINGMTDITFEPLGSATRAQAATIIAKLHRLSH